MTRRLSLAFVVLVACGGSPAPPGASSPAPAAAPAHAGHHDHERGPLVHRFERADEWAKVFDDPARDAWQKPAEVVAAMGVGPDMVVADVGAGTGYFEPHLSRAVGPRGTVLARDIEPDMVRYLGERARREGLANVKPDLSTTDDPKLPAGGVDRILIVDTWHHVGAREAFAAKLRDALKPGGAVFVVDFDMSSKHGPPVHHRLKPEVVLRELSSAGLRAELLETSLPDQYVVRATKP
jgi:predicted methyltransferase